MMTRLYGVFSGKLESRVIAQIKRNLRLRQKELLFQRARNEGFSHMVQDRLKNGVLMPNQCAKSHAEIKMRIRYLSR